MKNLLLFFVMLFLSSSCVSHAGLMDAVYNMVFSSDKPVTAQSTFTEYEATDYVNRVMSSVEQAFRAHVSRSELHALKQLVLKNVRDAQYAYQKSNSFLSS